MMRTFLLGTTHAFVFVLGIRFAEWSARENHASAFAAGRWLRSWFVQEEEGRRSSARNEMPRSQPDSYGGAQV